MKETYLINEAAKEVHVEAHVLRYWEEELKLPIKRNPQGHRIYSREDIETLIKIKNLKEKGLQLKAVKTFLEDNPFAQKHFTKLSKSPSEDTSSLKDTSTDNLSIENTSVKNTAVQNTSTDSPSVENTSLKKKAEEKTAKKNMIEIKSIKSIMKPKNELSEVNNTNAVVNANTAMTPAQQTERLQYLFQKLIREAVSANNEELVDRLVQRISGCVKDDVCKELDYQFRLFEERDEERASTRWSEEDKRSEEYYRRIDELLTQYRGKVRTAKKEKEEKTIKFPLTNKEKEPKAKKEFHLFKKTPEAKFQ